MYSGVSQRSESIGRLGPRERSRVVAPFGSAALLVVRFGLSVVGGAFLAGDETLQLEGLSGSHDGFEPLGDSSGLHPLPGEVGLLLGDDLAALGFSEVLLGEAASGSGAGAFPDLPFLADNGDLLGLSLSLFGWLLAALFGLLLGGLGSGSGLLGFLGGFSLSGFLLSSFSGHFWVWMWCWGWCVFLIVFGYEHARYLYESRGVSLGMREFHWLISPTKGF